MVTRLPATLETTSEFGFVFILMPAIALCLLGLALALWPGIWRATVEAEDRHRNHTLDGARGLLSLWVFSHHINMISVIIRQGEWRAPVGRLGGLIDTGFFVAPFFMLTAMLYGSRLLRGGGRLETLPFLVKRAFRIVPGYFLAVSLIVLVAFALSHFTLQVPPLKLAKQVGRWLLFDFVGRYDINGLDMAAAYGMMWTLRYEIMFYLMVPVIAFAQRRTGRREVAFLLLAAAGFVYWPFIFFTAGLFAVVGAFRWNSARAKWGWQAAAVVGIAMICITAPWRSTVLQAAFLIPVIVALALDGQLCAPLRWRPLRYVGEISYSLYLLHGPILHLLFAVAVDSVWMAHLPYLQRMAVGGAMATVTVGFATLCYVCIERPTRRLGERLATRLSRPAAARPAVLVGA